MKAEISGEIKYLKANEKRDAERLGRRRADASSLIDSDLARRGANLASRLGVHLALLIDREGHITHVVVGARDRIYLPDLGRFRLDKVRLRRLRLVVFIPEGKGELERFAPHEIRVKSGGKFVAGDSSFFPGSRAKKVEAPAVSHDLITDLEKLRFDAVVCIACDKEQAGSVTVVYLEPSQGNSGKKGRPERAFNFYHFRDVSSIDLDFDQLVAELEVKFRQSHEKLFSTSADTAVLVGAYTGSRDEANASMAELEELARTAGVEVLDSLMQFRRKLDPKTLIGKGKVEDLMLHCLDLGADLVIFDRELSPGQLRTVTNVTELKVLDRSMLILDIFAQRAKSSEGRLQVELAQLKYSLPRLSDANTGLSRLTGGIGGRGPGETKLEIGRRRTRDRIVDLEKRIKRVSTQRAVRRRRRQERGVPVIAIVGYTNAGKSTLLNALTKSKVFVEGKLFATLDTSSRRMRFPNEKEVIFVDTVGFIRELPKELITAFKATLEEVGEADILLHVVDASDSDAISQVEIVEKTLAELEYDKKPKILAMNKVDKISKMELSALAQHLAGFPISAHSREGLEDLILEIQERLAETFEGADPGQFIPLAN